MGKTVMSALAMATTQLDAQRTLHAAQRGLVTTHLAEQANRVTLYEALGGGWHGHNE